MYFCQTSELYCRIILNMKHYYRWMSCLDSFLPAQDAGYFTQEIAPITLKTRKGIVAFCTSNHRPLLHGLLSTLELTADIVCIHCFRFRYVTNVNHCIVPKVLIVPRSKSMRSRPDNGKNVRRKRHSVP